MIDSVTSVPGAPIGNVAAVPTGGWDVPVPDVDTIQRNIIDAASQVPIPDDDKLQKMLSERRQQLWQRREAQAQEAVRRRAIQAQSDSEGLVESPENLAARYQQTYERQAEALYATQITNEAQGTLNRLSQENRFDPEGFTAEWSQYTNQTVQQLSEAQVAPDLVESTLNTLMSYGVQTRLQIKDAAFARHQRVQSYNYRTGMDKTRSTAVEHLLKAPNEETLLQSRHQWVARVEAGVSTGYLTPTQGLNLRNEGLRAMTTAYVRGRFNEAMGAGDIDLAHQVIRGLKNGRWFSSISVGRNVAGALASQLASQQQAVRAVLDQRVDKSVTQLQRRKEIAQSGETIIPKDSPEVTHSMQVIRRYGTPEQQKEADQVLRATQVYAITQKNMGNRAPAEIQNLQDTVTAKYRSGKIEESVFEDFIQASNDRLQDISEAKQDNNVKMLTDTPVGAPAEDRLADIRHAARIAGVNPDSVKAYSADERHRFVDNYNAADSIEERLSIVNTVVEGTPADYIQSVKTTLADTGLGASMALLMANPEAGRVISTLAAQGRELPEQQAVDIPEYAVQGSKMYETATQLADGMPVLRSKLITTFKQSVEGLAANFMAQGKSPSDARGAAMEEWAQRTQVYRQGAVALTNGVLTDPERLAPQGVAPDEAVAAVNNFMNNSQAFATLRGNNALMGQIQPVPLPSGDIGFTSSVAPGSLLPTPDDVTIVLDKKQIEQFAQTHEDQGFFEWVIPGESEPAPTAPDDVTVNDDATAAELGSVNTGGLSNLMRGELHIAHKAVPGGHDWSEAVRLAVDDMSPEALGTRNADTGLPQARLAEVAKTSDYKQAMAAAYSELHPYVSAQRSDIPLPSESRLATFVASQVLMNQLRDTYSDPRVVAAHYWLSEQEVDMLKGAYGDDWYTNMPDDAALFAERVVGIHGRQRD